MADDHPGGEGPTTPSADRVRDLQRTLYRAAKADSRRRFHALWDKLFRRDVLETAWARVRASGGAAGIDRITLAEVEQYGVARLLDELAAELRAKRYRPLPGRRVWIPKPGSTERRPLAIPAVRDRIVGAATKIVIEPIFEADFRPSSFGFRPRLAAHDALQVLIDEAWRGRRWVVETDIASCFEAIRHDRLIAAVERRIVDQSLLKLLRAFLRAGVMEQGAVRRAVTGTPQGGVISPLLANVYLHALDVAWETRGTGVLVRYADDLVVMCRTEAEANAALDLLRAILAELGLAPKEAKTRIVRVDEGGAGFDFLGFEHHWVRGTRPTTRHITFLARWPSRQAMAHARERLRALTARERLRLSVEAVVAEVNAFLRGWAGYFRYGNSARHFDLISRHAQERIAIFLANRRAWSRGKGFMVAARSDWLGLVSLSGTVISPRPNWGWRGTPNAGGERRR
jgi:RNA-directed DNA polymerase